MYKQAWLISIATHAPAESAIELDTIQAPTSRTLYAQDARPTVPRVCEQRSLIDRCMSWRDMILMMKILLSEQRIYCV